MSRFTFFHELQCSNKKIPKSYSLTAGFIMSPRQGFPRFLRQRDRLLALQEIQLSYKQKNPEIIFLDCGIYQVSPAGLEPATR